jgi:hypothetical protein
MAGMFFSRRGKVLMLVSFIVAGITSGATAFVDARFVWPGQVVAPIIAGFSAAVLSWLAFGAIATKLGY